MSIRQKKAAKPVLVAHIAALAAAKKTVAAAVVAAKNNKNGFRRREAVFLLQMYAESFIMVYVRAFIQTVRAYIPWVYNRIPHQRHDKRF